MLDNNWEEVSGDDAHEIEVLNYSNQVNVIEALVRYFMHIQPPGEHGCPMCPNERVLKEFHRTATLFLLTMPGEYRGEEVHVAKAGEVVHRPPSHTEVEAKISYFFDDLRARWLEHDAATLAAYSLWFVNWVHPFKNGNGRTARAFSYACLQLRLGFILPGTKTVIDLVMDNRDDYEAALKIADLSYEATGTVEIAPMTTFVSRLLEEQLNTVLEA